MTMTAHPCEYTENRWIVHLEWFVCELYLSKGVIYWKSTCFRIIKSIKSNILSIPMPKSPSPLSAAAASAKSLQSCLTLCDPLDGSPPGCAVPGILQVRTLEWVAISFSNAWKWKVKVKSLSCLRLLATPWTAAYQAPLSIGFSRQEYWSGVPLPSLSPLSILPQTAIHWDKHFESLIFSVVTSQSLSPHFQSVTKSCCSYSRIYTDSVHCSLSPLPRF